MIFRSAILPLVAAAATATAVVASPIALAEEIHTDNLGNILWGNDDRTHQVAPLGRPDFSHLKTEAVDAFDKSEKSVLAGFEDLVGHVVDKVHQGEKVVNGWIKQANVWVEGQEYQRLTHPHFPEYALRVSTSSNTTICDPSVKSYSGYFDISETKHLWFVFFEARHKPEKAPLAMWLNGGPGCSSSTGLLFELGPCRIANKGDDTVNNPYSWTNNVNMIFLDQPVNVGYSYSEDETVNNTPAASEDVYAFLQLFLQKFTEYNKKPFTIVGESYGGTYIPHFASTVWQKNKELKKAVSSNGISTLAQTGKLHINLESIAIGNGLTEPLTQFPSVHDYACGADNPYALFKNDSDTCTSLQAKAKTCSGLIEQCYKYDSRLVCLPAALYCWSNLYSPLQDSGLNLYDVRRKCDRSEDKDGPLCYKEMGWMETYMNKPEVRKAWGAHEGVKFQSCNMQVNQGFLFQGDSTKNSAAFLPEMIDEGLRVLIYAGETDAMCNHIGNQRWVEKLETAYSSEFLGNPKKTWKVDGEEAGWVRTAGKGAGNVAYVKVSKAGHMVPFDQPVAALEMWEKWVANEKLV